MERFFQPNNSVPPTKLAFLSLEGVEVDMEIGVDDKEQGHKQRIIIDVQVGIADQKTNLIDSRAGLEEGFDYGQIRDCILKATDAKINLLETLSNNIAASILDLHGALTCRVKVTKTRCWANVNKTSVDIYRTK